MNEPSKKPNFSTTKNREKTGAMSSRHHDWSGDYQPDTGEDIGEAEPPPNDAQNGCPEGAAHLPTIRTTLLALGSPLPPGQPQLSDEGLSYLP